MRRLIFIFGIVIALIWVTPAAAEERAPFVSPADCPIEIPAGTNFECGYLHTPENYEQPDGRWINMPYIILYSENPDTSQPPLFFTSGGPGGDSLRAVWWMPKTGFLQDRDVIIFQQRGNFHADPALACEVDEIYDQATGISPCFEKIKSAGIDLTQYHTSVIAEDIESLRVALEIDQWDFWGVSYSTRLAQVLMDRYPDGLRSVILQSVSLLNETRFQHDPEHSYRALKVMFEDCAADEACAAAYPDLEDRFYGLVKELNQNPIELTWTDITSGGEVPFQFSGHTLISWMVTRSFYQHAYPPYETAVYPLLIDALSQGNTDFLPGLVQYFLETEFHGSDLIAFGLYLAANCQDDAGSIMLDQIEEQIAAYPQLDGYYRHMDEWQICQLWDLPPSPSLANAPLTSDIPTLVLAGRYDPITPPEWSKSVADKLVNAYYFEFNARGHDIDTGTDCGIRIKHRFLQDPWSEPESSCLADDPPPTFVLPDDLVPLEGFIRSVEDIDFGVPEHGSPVVEAISGASLGIFIFEILLFLVLSVVLAVKWSERKEKVQSIGYLPHILGFLSAVLSIGSVFLISKINQEQVWVYGMLNSLGFFQSSPEVIVLGIAVLAQMIVATFLVLTVIRVWWKKQTRLVNRIYLSVVSLAGISFWVFYIRWDLVRLLFIEPGL